MGEFAPLQVVKQPVTLESFDYRETLKNTSPFRQTMTDYICSFCYFVVSLQNERFFIYYIKVRVHGVKTYSINGKDALTGDWIYVNSILISYVKHMYVVYVCRTT